MCSIILIIDDFEKQKYGCLAVITSVAGDRGRQSNYVLGSVKAAVSTFLEGLHCRLNKENINIITVKPGFVDTPMTAHLKKNFFFTEPQKIGMKIYRVIINGKNGVIYVPGYWRIIMFIIRNIPEFIFKKMSL